MTFSAPAVTRTTFLDQPAWRLELPGGDTAHVLQHGAHLVSWVRGGEEQLYLSPLTRVAEGVAVRGGVPVLFPQFSDAGPGPRHGFARTRAWTFGESAVGREHALLVLRLQDDESTRAVWPHAFEAELTVALAEGRLDVELSVANTGEAPLRFTGGLHTYVGVRELAHLRIEGLHGLPLHDRLRDEQRREDHHQLGIHGEMENLYAAVHRPLLLREPGRQRVIDADGFDELMLWNPGPAKAHALADLPDEDWQRFVCVEAVRVNAPVEVAPGETWIGRQGLLAGGA